MLLGAAAPLVSRVCITLLGAMEGGSLRRVPPSSTSIPLAELVDKE
jgi:hypothetical protein